MNCDPVRCRRRSGRRRARSGFALTLVFLLAALIAIALYRELPRVAFEAQRDREELLIARGEEYKRAIQLFFRENNRFPQSLDQLEKFNNKRYLRRRYKDPMTGQDEWRVLNYGPSGICTNCLVKNTQGAPKVGMTAEEMAKQQQDQPANQEPRRVGAWARTRPSDVQPAPNPNAAPPPELDSEPQVEVRAGGQVVELDPQPAEPQQPGQQAADQPPVAPPGAPPFPWQQGQQQAGGQPGQPGQPGRFPLPGQPGWQPGMQAAQAQGPFQSVQPAPQMPPPGSEPLGTVVNSQPASTGTYSPYQAGRNQAPSLYGNRSQSPSQSAAGFGGTGVNTVPDAVNNQIFGQGRPGVGQAGMSFGGGGIAGVASKSEEEGIKLYNERSKYKEWEFVYNPTKDATSPIGQRMGAGLPQTGGATGTGTGAGTKK